MMNSKKGISAIVATVLIILITVAAVTIIWAAIIPMINNQLDKGTLCLDAVTQLSIKEDNTQFSGDNLTVQIEAGPKDVNLKDIQIIVSSAGNSVSYLVSNDTGGVIGPDGVPGQNAKLVYNIDVGGSSSLTGVDSVEIAPIVTIGNGEEVCGVSSSLELN